MKYYLFTSESVSEGHPDKLADQISDAIVDALLTRDRNARIACETMVNTGMAIICGEITTTAAVNIVPIVRDTVRAVGYTSSDIGYDADTIAVIVSLDEQSADIAVGVDDSEAHEQGAGDQGLMFGYACNETDNFMPAAIDYAHQLVRKQAEVRKSGRLAWLRPDAKSQLTLRYEDGKPVGIEAVVLSTQHSPEVSPDTLREGLMEEIIKPVLPVSWLDQKTTYHLNPTGRFVLGGPKADCGLTGRKIIVDSYGGAARHGGGAFSGKDPSKVDRSAAYAARYVAKNIVAARLAERCEVQLSYAIGIAPPTSIHIETFGTGVVSETKLVAAVRACFELRPKGIINTLNLLRPIYQPTASYGHFGRSDLDLPWESLDKVETLKAAV